MVSDEQTSGKHTEWIPISAQVSCLKNTPKSLQLCLLDEIYLHGYGNSSLKDSSSVITSQHETTSHDSKGESLERHLWLITLNNKPKSEQNGKIYAKTIKWWCRLLSAPFPAMTLGSVTSCDKVLFVLFF